MSLIVISSGVDFVIAQYIQSTNNKRYKKIFLSISLLSNLGILFVFKYCNFFIETFVEAFLILGTSISYDSMRIVLPVGISFYTFQTLSYTIDVYRDKMKPTTDVISFFAFVSFFPQLVAGPIERATNLLPQFQKKRKFEYQKVTDGLRLILGGLFKKMVIADNCALIVNNLFDNYTDYSGSTLLCGAIFFGFQIYGDFSGYSDIAIGTARLLGFDLMKNFNFPYLSKNLITFWRLWHISLSTWFRDYVYIPLGGNRVATPRFVVNVLIVFLVSGLWHGANLTYIMWGLIHGVGLIITVFTQKLIKPSTSKILDVVYIGSTFLIVMIAWVFFRAATVTDAFGYIQEIFSKSLFSVPQGNKWFLLFLCGYMCIEWLQQNRSHVLDITHVKYKPIRYIIYYTTIGSTLYYAGDLQTFIYFQF